MFPFRGVRSRNTVPEAIQEFDQLIGRLISGRYRVKRLLGQGGMGKVYQAKQIALGREVALKVLSASYTGEGDPEFHKRFFHEAAIMAKLKSPHTVMVFDYGYDQDVYYIAMELVTGRPLDRELKRGVMPIPRVLSIVEQVCRSLREAHSKGIVHRDLKPGNVILTTGDEGEEMVKLLDFGLAKRMTTTEESNPDLIPGSPKYMSPELIRQQPVDGRADIYGLGVMLYQMLTGVVPFDHENPLEILKAHLFVEPPPMASKNPRYPIPPTLEKMVMRCLAKDPALRYRNIHEVIGTLRQVAQELGLSDGSIAALSSMSMPPAPMTPAQVPTPSVPPRSISPSAPSVATSQRPSPQKAASAPSPGLRMAIDDEIPEAMRPAADWNLARVFPVVTVAVLLVIGAAYYAFGGSDEKDAVSVVPLSVAEDPSAVGQNTATGSPAGNKDMVFTVDDVDKGETQKVERTIRIEVSSDPAGATVLIGKQTMGQTPTTLEWSGKKAERGKTLELRLDKSGYQTEVVKRTIDKDLLTFSVRLKPKKVQKAIAKSAPVKKVVPRSAPQEPAESEFEEALEHLQGRDWKAPVSNEAESAEPEPEPEAEPQDELSDEQLEEQPTEQEQPSAEKPPPAEEPSSESEVEQDPYPQGQPAEQPETPPAPPSEFIAPEPEPESE
jgi:serine/threonine protein kinase